MRLRKLNRKKKEETEREAMKPKKPVCKVCNGTKTVTYMGRTFACGACSPDPFNRRLAKLFREAARKLGDRPA